MSSPTPLWSSWFLETTEHRRFAEFCDACRDARYIGLCYGPPGVGKTVSGQYYSRADQLEAYLFRLYERVPPPDTFDAGAVLYTPPVAATARHVKLGVFRLLTGIDWAARDALAPERMRLLVGSEPRVDLLIVDEADRLRTLALEQLRALYDEWGFGLVLIGMPGLEKRLARYPQLYSRVGFVHRFRALAGTDLDLLLDRKVDDLAISRKVSVTLEPEARAAIVRVTQGNFRLVDRLFAQIERVLQLNTLDQITVDVIDAAREGLVIGTV